MPATPNDGGGFSKDRLAGWSPLQPVGAAELRERIRRVRFAVRQWSDGAPEIYDQFLLGPRKGLAVQRTVGPSPHGGPREGGRITRVIDGPTILMRDHFAGVKYRDGQIVAAKPEWRAAAALLPVPRRVVIRGDEGADVVAADAPRGGAAEAAAEARRRPRARLGLGPGAKTAILRNECSALKVEAGKTAIRRSLSLTVHRENCRLLPAMPELFRAVVCFESCPPDAGKPRRSDTRAFHYFLATVMLGTRAGKRLARRG